MKKLINIRKSHSSHWVGNGFPVRSVFSYSGDALEVSPFLLLDYAGPAHFAPTSERLGVGEHPHRGFETVTIVYSGEVEHRDSHGGGGIVKPGDVQWMTAASGLVHEEFHGREFAKKGGPFEMVQLWVNLPQKFKMTKPRYQAIKSEAFPTVTVNGGSVRVIAGEFQNHQGAAQTFSPINLWDIRLKSGATLDLTLPSGHTTLVFVLSGTVTSDHKKITSAEVGVFETSGTELSLTATEDSVILFLGGEPLNEPVVGYGPFVMNTKAEIDQAISDYHNGKMGTMV